MNDNDINDPNGIMDAGAGAVVGLTIVAFVIFAIVKGCCS